MEVVLKYETVEDGVVKDTNYSIKSDLEGIDNILYLRNAIKTIFIDVTNEVYQEELANGFDPKANRFVDNDVRKDLADVEPFGKVQYVARADMYEMLLDIYERILATSPILTGRYQKNNLIFYNNTQIATDMDELVAYLATNPAFESKDQIRFVNISPYARKLERYGITKERGSGKLHYAKLKVNKKKNRDLLGYKESYLPSGVYALEASLAKRRYGKNSFISFSFIDGGAISGVSTDSGGLPINRYVNGKGNGRKSSDRTGKPYFYPCIVINVIGAGITNGETPSE
jgi:hypothetical protein